MAKLFNEPSNIYKWKQIQTWLLKSQYNELLDLVIEKNNTLYGSILPNFLNKNYCLTIGRCTGADININALNEKVDLAGTISFQSAAQTLIILQNDVNVALTAVTTAENNLLKVANGKSKAAIDSAERALEQTKQNLSIAIEVLRQAQYQGCFEPTPPSQHINPVFGYERMASIPQAQIPVHLDLNFLTSGITTGAVIWLYFYERMGIFKILGALMDDYNYRGKYTISGNRNANYSSLMDTISSLHRLGISSNLRDRVCTYQRVLGISIENNLGIESERNTGFMQTFNKLVDYMLEYYKSKQLAQAIQSQNGIIQPRSSVATQTSIRDTINILKQQFEPLQYGRNQTNIFLGIATVHATICLVNLLKAEIGIPTQYDKPEEIIPAAYDILVSKRPATLNTTNRYIVYDNCASYGYRILTDIETADINQFRTIASGADLDVWLNDIEGWVEGYRNAYSSVPEKVDAIV